MIILLCFQKNGVPLREKPQLRNDNFDDHNEFEVPRIREKSMMISDTYKQSPLIDTQLALEGIRYHCDRCGYKTQLKKDLRKHIEGIHEGVRYPCNQCDYKATRRENLKRHVLRTQ